MFVLAAAAGYFVIGALGALAAATVVLASIADFVFPTTYELTRDRAVCRRVFGTTEIQWENVKRCYLDDLGVKLSPFGRLSRLEAFRGVYLRFAGNQEQVIEAVRSLRTGAC
jgi:hypothetical protein